MNNIIVAEEDKLRAIVHEEVSRVFHTKQEPKMEINATFNTNEDFRSQLNADWAHRRANASPDFDTFILINLQYLYTQYFTNIASPKWVTQAKKEYFCGMFVRKKKNRSGTTSVVVVDKSGKHFRELKTIGVSNNESEIDNLYQQGKK